LLSWPTTKSTHWRQPFGTTGANPTEIRRRSYPTEARFGPANWKAGSTVSRRWNQRYTAGAKKRPSTQKYDSNGNKADRTPRWKNLHKIGIFCATSKARPNQKQSTIASMVSTRTSMTSKTSWRRTPILKTTALEFWDKKNSSKENKSASAGINYKDEPTLKSKRLKRS
jgi:hypothetical protein